MDCYPRKVNTSPFVVRASIDANCPSECPDPKLVAHNHCYWDEALFDCFQDFSGSTSHSRRSVSHDFQVNTDKSYAAGSTTTIKPQLDVINNGSINVDDPIVEEADGGYGGHAALSYDELLDAGPPARPQEFPTPYVHDGVRTTIRAMDHRTHKIREVKNVLLSSSHVDGGAGAGGSSFHQSLMRLSPHIADRAYLLKKKISKTAYGNQYLSVVLQRRGPSPSTSFDRETDEKRPEEEVGVRWESTEEFVTITVSPWSRAMRYHRRSLSQKREGPLHAIAAMQHVGNYHPHVLGLLAVFQDEEHLYTITPFHSGIDLQTAIMAGREQGQYLPNEAQARLIFIQLLQAIFHLQRKGVCHSNLSLENIFIDRNNQNLTIVDLGRSFRVPYNDPSNYGCLTGETEGTTRRLLRLNPHDFATHPTENLMYLAPEIVENEDAFDGFTADLWAAACVLFVLLVGMAPFKTAHYWDAAYAEISSGNLKGLLASLKIHLSDEATGLLQNMMWRDPRDRLTLAQILDHPWVKNERFPTRTSTKATATDAATAATATSTPASAKTATTTSSSIPRNTSSSRLSSAGSASTTSSFATEKSDKARLSTGSHKSLAKALSGMFRTSSSSKDKDCGSISGSSTKGGWSGLLSSHRGSHRRKSSLGGWSSAASSATAGSPSSLKSLAGGTPAEEEKQDAFGFQVLQIPSL